MIVVIGAGNSNQIIARLAAAATGDVVLVTADGSHWERCEDSFEAATGERRGRKIGNEIVEHFPVIIPPKRIQQKKQKSEKPFYEKFLK